ncbi:unnamed protein product [Pseudo-nitzschia multistriata]|uniref:FAS1 domain-containing protein n=1 Tax=Pseudo-nitzschia multistriata TaxID=183589 RepID=A0A448ZPH1_9STRA|nr:unnamed protein product [Pseudo-nitzschia multistriata]
MSNAVMPVPSPTLLPGANSGLIAVTPPAALHSIQEKQAKMVEQAYYDDNPFLLTEEDFLTDKEEFFEGFYGENNNDDFYSNKIGDDFYGSFLDKNDDVNNGKTDDGIVQTDDFSEIVLTDDFSEIVQTDDFSKIVQTDDFSEIIQTDDFSEIVLGPVDCVPIHEQLRLNGSTAFSNKLLQLGFDFMYGQYTIFAPSDKLLNDEGLRLLSMGHSRVTIDESVLLFHVSEFGIYETLLQPSGSHSRCNKAMPMIDQEGDPEKTVTLCRGDDIIYQLGPGNHLYDSKAGSLVSMSSGRSDSEIVLGVASTGTAALLKHQSADNSNGNTSGNTNGSKGADEAIPRLSGEKIRACSGVIYPIEDALLLPTLPAVVVAPSPAPGDQSAGKGPTLVPIWSPESAGPGDPNKAPTLFPEPDWVDIVNKISGIEPDGNATADQEGLGMEGNATSDQEGLGTDGNATADEAGFFMDGNATADPARPELLPGMVPTTDPTMLLPGAPSQSGPSSTSSTRSCHPLKSTVLVLWVSLSVWNGICW